MEGLEKIAADLRVERTKATNALRDRARLKVDNESLHQELKEKEDQVGVLEESLTDLKEQLASSRHAVEKFEDDFDRKRDEVAQQKAQILEMKEERTRNVSEKDTALTDLQTLEKEVFALREENEMLKGKLFSAEKMQRKMEAEASEVVILKNTLEEEHTVNLEKLRERSRLVESMKDRIAAAEALELSYKQAVAANEGLKAELDSSIKAESKLSDSARKYAREYTEKSIAREMMTEELTRLKQEQGEARGLYKALEQANTELKGRIQAEVEGHGFTKQRADSLQKSLDGLRSELGNASRSVDDFRSQNSTLELSLSKYKVELKEANEKIASLRVSSDAVAKLRVNLAEAQAAAKEGEDAKSQLFNLKKQMTKANLEAGRSGAAISLSQSFNSNNASFSESGAGAGLISAGKYEEMIQQLNEELSASDAKLQTALKDLSETQQRITELKTVEEELALTKAAAEELSLEKQAQATTAAEAAERSLRMLASKEGAVREVMALEREIEQSKRELEYTRGELSKEKLKNKTLYAEKLGAERHAAEKTAVCSRIEGELEGAKNNSIEKEYELEHQKRRERELEAAVESARLTLWQMENRPHAEAGQRASPLSAALSSFPPPPTSTWKAATPGAVSAEYSTLSLQLEQAEHQLSLCHKEIESLKENVAVQRRGFDNALEECNRLYEANRRLKRQLYPDMAPSDDALDGAAPPTSPFSSRAHTEASTIPRTGGIPTAFVAESSPAPAEHLQSVRQELTETMTSMQEASAAALHKDRLVQQLQAELEEEKGTLLAMQDKFTALADRETEMVTGKPAPAPVPTDNEGKPDLEEYADRLIDAGHMKPPSSPMGMMPYSSPTLKQSKSKMAFAHLAETGRASELHITRNGVVVSDLSPTSRALPESQQSQSGGSPISSHHMSSFESKEADGGVSGQDTAQKTFDADVKMIKSRKGTSVAADKALNHRRRLEANHQKERELRREAMQAVRRINRRQLQSGAVAEGHSASSSPMPTLKQILPQKTDIHQAHRLMTGSRAGPKKTSARGSK